jgi:hypothetical protein
MVAALDALEVLPVAVDVHADMGYDDAVMYRLPDLVITWLRYGRPPAASGAAPRSGTRSQEPLYNRPPISEKACNCGPFRFL